MSSHREPNSIFYHWNISASGVTFELVGGSTYSVGMPAMTATDTGALGLTYRSGELVNSDSCIEQPDVLHQLTRNSGGTWQPEQRIGGSTQTFRSSGGSVDELPAYALGEYDELWRFSSDRCQWQPIVAAPTSFAGSPGAPIALDDGVSLYMRTDDNDLARIVSNGSLRYMTLGLNPGDSGAPQGLVDSPLDTPDGVYWTGQDGQIRFYNGSDIHVLNAVDTKFRDDFEGVLNP